MSNILETVDLCKDFAGFRAVNNVSLKVREGDIHALIGPNGAGKTTVFNLLTKFMQPSSGKILFQGKDITHEKPARLAKQGIVRSFQISATFPDLTVLENVRIALQRRLAPTYAFWKSGTSLDHLNANAMEYLEQVDMQDFASVKAADLPYGRKRSVEIATTLAMEPRLMLLDEPTQGMGHEDVEQVTQLIKRVSVGRTILMVEHNMKVVSGICDRISVLQRGAVLAEGTYKEVASDPRVLEAYMGTETELAGGQ